MTRAQHFVFDHGQDFIERLFDLGRSGDAGVVQG